MLGDVVGVLRTLKMDNTYHLTSRHLPFIHLFSKHLIKASMY